MSREEFGGERAWQADYEVYGQRAAGSEDAQVEIRVGLKRSAEDLNSSALRSPDQALV